MFFFSSSALQPCSCFLSIPMHNEPNTSIKVVKNNWKWIPVRTKCLKWHHETEQKRRQVFVTRNFPSRFFDQLSLLSNTAILGRRFAKTGHCKTATPDLNHCSSSYCFPCSQFPLFSSKEARILTTKFPEQPEQPAAAIAQQPRCFLRTHGWWRLAPKEWANTFTRTGTLKIKQSCRERQRCQNSCS